MLKLSALKLKIAEKHEIGDIEEFAHKLWLSQYQLLGTKDYDRSKVYNILQKVIEGNPSENLILLCHRESILVGVLGCVVAEPLWTYQKLATELLFHIHDEHSPQSVAHALLRAYRYWAKKVGCSYIEYSVVRSGKEIHTIRKL